MAEERTTREVIVCLTCEGRPNVATAYIEKVEEAIEKLGKMRAHLDHEFGTTEALDKAYDVVLSREPTGIYIYGKS